MRSELAAILLAVGAVSACGAPDAGPGEASEEGIVLSSMDVLFTVRGEGTNDLQILSADGTMLHLTPDSDGDNWGVWSPDGSAIAFQARRDGNTEVYVMDPDGGNPRNISSHPAHDGLPVWSPDGESIAFFSSRGLQQDSLGLPGHIYVIGSDGDQGGLRRVTVDPLESTLGPGSWSPDGRHLFYTRLTGSGSKLVRYELATSREEVLYESAAVMGGGVVSPDGELLATYVDEGSQSRIAILRQGNPQSDLEFVSPAGSYHAYPRWSPDGRHIIYTARATDGRTFDIESVELETGATQVILGSARSELEASWRPRPW